MTLGILIGIFGSFANIFCGALLLATDRISNPKYYSYLISKNIDAREIELQHFPKEITDDMSEIKFIWVEAFLQGGASRELKYKAKNIEHLENIYNKYKKRALKIYKANEYCNYCNDKEQFNNQYYDYPSFYIDFEIDDSFYIIIIDNQPYISYFEDHHWNHGYSYGIVFNFETLEIAYWYHYW